MFDSVVPLLGFSWGGFVQQVLAILDGAIGFSRPEMGIPILVLSEKSK
ncbi:MAG: hypothetical protein WAZ77_04915 [Candidatus Nitrosopolaris sp.]